ncbi:Phytochrome two-component sensor histidine kinase Cyanobacterial phytochrome B [Paramagnetospirillum magnetotacticum MS-1]|uniref:histidine kinase n=1 Tax=Paramagnetospirillum magnetotacticum MS-1 TaxID=272627 RepID=A0A0C2V079_PARME|nr:ATP-binding protein [Paramagnetospirillum magnetotacticum]KIL98501.1 Phytochrome two-component sensor histidine kinase Cyanobacterial phytochrome B [Paramagnetospirillum magnetotacticum MS-1]
MRVAWRITGIYAAVGLSWIFLSSLAVWISVGEPPGLASLLELAKGCAFILVTAVMLLVLLRRWEGELNRRGRALEQSNRDLSELNARLSGIMRDSQDLIAAWDRDKRLTAFNPRYQSVCWSFFQTDVKIGMPLEEIFAKAPDRLRLFSECWDRTLAGESFVQLQSLSADGDTGWFETSYGSLAGADGRPCGGFHIVRDVTDRVRAEENGRLHAENLAKTVETLTEANAELERFAFVASHDLQEPLRTIACFAQLVERDYGEGLDDRGREYLDLVTGGAIRMNQLINDLLAYSRISRSEGRMAEISAMSACESALTNLREAIDSSRAEITVIPLPNVTADSVMLIQVFQNLIGNAIKYRKEGCAPHIQVAAVRQDRQWLFSVSDDGIGFDPKEQDVFELFRRLHPHSSYAGTGVGLTICKRIITRLGGHIWVESNPGAGSVFRFTLPLADESLPVPPQS